MSIEILNWDKKTDIKLFTITNKNKMKARFTNYGAILVSLFVPDKKDNLVDIVLRF